MSQVIDTGAAIGITPRARTGSMDGAAEAAKVGLEATGSGTAMGAGTHLQAPVVDGEYRFTGEGVTGITFERRWTTPGVHPYDEVAWELRTASISSETGKTVFEQTDVEVPVSWSQLATNVVVSKYFRGHIGTPGREHSVRQLIDRVVNTITSWAATQRYFATDEDLQAFKAELTHLLVHQKMSFNSPVWFNVGVEERPQCSACFINSVQDSMSSIMDLAKTEAMLFKYGSGAGVNLSPIRGSNEKMSGGGIASGPVSFMKGFDAFAGVVKSGGKTRRAAKMVILDADHPDVMEFIDSKMNEEKKAWALIEAGYDPSFTGEAYGSVFFQNANHSVRVTDGFMQAVVDGADWTTHEVTTGDSVDTLPAKSVFRRMAEAAWICGDPGIQYDTTINDWHTSAVSDRIYASNPCVTGDTLVATDRGWKRIDSLVGQTANIIGADGRAHHVTKVFPTGRKQVSELRTVSGYRVRITADHKVATMRGDVPVNQLTYRDRIHLGAAGFGTRSVEPSIAEIVGLAVGDGCLSRSDIHGRVQETLIITMHADEAAILARAADVLNEQKAILKAVGSVGRNSGVSVALGPTGSRLAFGSRPVVDLITRYAVLDEGAALKRFDPAVFELDRPSVAALLRGLFTADGTVVDSGDKVQYVGLDSTSLHLLLQVQRLLLGFGIKAKIYEDRRAGKLTAMLPDGQGGHREYVVKETHSLRVTRSSRLAFEREIGFAPESDKATRLRKLNLRVSSYRDEMNDLVDTITPLGEEDVFDLTEPVTSHFVANGLVVHNCSEYMFLNDTACNLASMNLMKYVDEDGEFDPEAFRHATRVTITAQEIMVDNASYPTPQIEENSHRFRPLGIGYANLGALLMDRGLAYDSDEGRSYAAAITAIMTGEAYRQSAMIARDHGGPFNDYAINEQPFLRVMGKHQVAAYALDESLTPRPMIDAARRAWDEAIEIGERHGFRNAQSSVLAPTGTIAFYMDCDTTGIEPDIALVKYKKLVGEGFLKIVNQTVPNALRRLGYSAEETQAIVEHIDQHETIEGAPGLKDEHLAVFDCAFKPVNGERSIHYMGHVRMMGATQPFLSGAISKTVNMPEAATAEDIEDVYLQGWKLGLKAIAIYRDGSKRSQPLSTGRKKDSDTTASQDAVAAAPTTLGVTGEPKPYRRRLPSERQAITHKFQIAGHEGYITVGLYEDGQPGELFLKMAKEGSTISGLMDTIATMTSVSLQYGVPLRDLVNKFAHVRFEPAGFTGNPEIPIAKSIVDYVFRWMGSRFLPAAEREALGLINQDAQQMPLSFGGSAIQPAALAVPSPLEVSATASADTSSADAFASSAIDAPATPPLPAAAGTSSPAAANPLPVLVGAAATNGNGNGHMNGNGNGSGNGLSAFSASLGATTKVSFSVSADSPSCADCGSIMVRNGSCYKCLNCGSTSGCS